MSALALRDDWPHWKKMLVITTLLVPVMAWLVFGDGSYPFAFLAYGLGVSALGGSWLTGRAWLLVPLLAMGLFLVFAIPAAATGNLGDETPFSVLIEAPFWAGAPTFVGAFAGATLRMLHDRPR